MELFESILVLVLVAIVLLQVARRLADPTMLALAGVLVAALPWAPHIAIDPKLALALFIAPALLDAAYDLPPRELRRYWLPLLALAAVAVVLTTAAVAWTAVAIAGFPLAAAIALGAIVAPPDAAAAAAVLARFNLPRRTVTVLKGESLLNDAVALLIFAAAVSAATSPTALSALVPELTLAVPGGLIVGITIGMAYVWLSPRLAGTLGSTLFEFVTTFGAWIIAERLHLSAILSVVAFAMTVARYTPERQSPRDRVHSYSVWDAMVFLLNVLAFFLMGLQAREIVTRLDSAQVWDALGFAAMICAVVILIRLAWVILYNRVYRYIASARGMQNAPSLAHGLLVSWCGMRGLVTLAAALSLPSLFPERDLIVLSAFAVVLGTLVVQGLTLGPLIGLLSLPPDHSFEQEVSTARLELLDAAIANLADRDDEFAARLRQTYRAERAIAERGEHPRAVSERDSLRRQNIMAKREKLADLRRQGRVGDDVFHALEQELDWAELAASPPDRVELIEG